MALKGDLASVDLAQMFQMLALNKKVGLLSIQSPRTWKVLYFDGRGVTLYFNEHSLLDCAIAAFVRAERLKQKAVEELRAHASRNHLSLQDALLAGGYLAEADLAEQMRYELEEEVYDLFFWKSARFEFHEGVAQLTDREGVIDERFFFHTESVIMEAARRIDEWSYISERIPSALEIICPSDQQFIADEVDQFGALVYEHVDGCHNVARLIELTGLPKFTVFKSLCQLGDAGFVVPLPPEELLPLGKQCLNKGRTRDAINLFEKAIEIGVGIPTVHAMAAGAYQAQGEYEDAIRHMQSDAEFRIGDGDFRTAAAKLKAAIDLVPTNLAGRERLVEVVLENGLRVGDYDAVEDGKQLVDLYLLAGEIGRVRGILERLLRVQPNDLDLKKLLVNVHSKAGDQQRVIDLYLSIADGLVRDQRPLEAIGYLQKILMIDRARSDVSERLRSLYALDERARRRRRTVVGLGVLSVLLVVAFVSFGYYDQRAHADFQRINVTQLLAANEYEQAELEYQRFVTEHPLSTANTLAAEELSMIGGKRAKFDADRASVRAAKERSLGSLRQDYRAEWRRYEDLFKAGKPEESLTSVARVRKLVAEAGQRDDHAWALEEHVESTFVRLSTFINRAGELRRALDQSLAAGRIEEARRCAVELVTSYDIAAVARGAVIPVRIHSRPEGARILVNGKPLIIEVNGKSIAALTPAVVNCSLEIASYALELAGFESLTFQIDARRQAEVALPLVLVPERRIRFQAPATVLGLGGGYVVASLRTGSVSIASAASGVVRRTVELGGLREVDGEMVVAGDCVYFITNEGSLECLALRSGASPAGWPVKLKSVAATTLQVRDGRLLFADRAGNLCCYDQATGHPIWTAPYEGVIVGVPTIENRAVRIAGADGTVRVYDAASGKLVCAVRITAGLSTRVLAEGGTWWVGGVDGKLHSFDEKRLQYRWSIDAGRVIADGEIALAGKAVVALCADNRLTSFDRQTGAVHQSVELAGTLVSPLRIVGTRLLVVTRIKVGKEKPRDVLSVYSADSLILLYEYAASGVISGVAGTETQTAVAGPDGDVVLLR